MHKLGKLFFPLCLVMLACVWTRAYAFLPDPRVHPSTNISDFLAKHKIITVEDYARWLAAHMRYVADRGPDLWAEPYETLERGFGDCEDMAFLTAEVLRNLGYEPHVLAYAGQPGEAHAFCVFKKNETFLVFDNTQLNSTPAKSLADFAYFGLVKLQSKLFLELNLPSRTATVLMKKRIKT